jgi:hypothetical protein
MHNFPSESVIFHRPPSKEYRKHFPEQPLICNIPRFTRFDEREFVNNHFTAFADSQIDFKIPADIWRVPVINVETSYQETSKFTTDFVFHYDLSLLQRCIEDVSHHLGPSLETAGTMAVEEVKLLIDMSASSGTGYNHRPGAQTKRKAEETINITRDYELMRNSWCISNGFCLNPIPELFLNQTKWELRKVGKPPRTFMAGPYKLHLMKAQLFQAQNLAMVDHFREIWPNVGVSPLRRGWNDLYHRLKNHATNSGVFWESDFSGWDRSLPAIFMWACMFVRIRCWPKSSLTQSNIDLAQMAYYLTINAFVWLEKGEVFQKNRGMPSGDAMTIFDNCIAHMIAFIYVLRRIKPNITFKEIMHYFLLCLMGDDNIGARKQSLTGWFSTSRLKDEFGEMGLTLKYCTESYKLESLGYLSKNFQNYKGVWLARPDRVKLLCQAAFGNKSIDPKLMYVRLCSLRIEAFPDQELFYFLDRYTKHFLEHHREAIVAPGDLSWNMIKSVYLTVTAIEALHLGYESGTAGESLSHFQLFWDDVSQQFYFIFNA